jgi:muconolactone delta-isomerase
MFGTWCRLVLASFLIVPACWAQTDNPPAAQSKPVVTTKILAIGTRLPSMTEAQRGAIMPKEVRATVRLYLDGKIDQWWVRGDGKGVVFLMNVTSVEEAHSLLEKLPLGQAKLMTFEFVPLGPLSPLRFLLDDSSVPSKN